MRITFTPAAAKSLTPYIEDGRKQLKLLHDTEGCGCVVSGVPALQLIEQGGPDDRLTQGDPFPFWYEPRHEVFFEPELRIDYDAARDAYSLKSDSQIYTLDLRFLKN
ncbi:iron-sulfur cluster biosynthesis family protein [Paenibacillus glycanilyticus]|uniref:iron-sulfur cluster biosynthesis family protein n=1 Tax=Paenibacillus glycanilyticus TaxID=126569 RepID=UPI003EBC3454